MLYYHCKFILENGKTDDVIIPAEDHISLMEQVHLQDGILVKFTKISHKRFKMSAQDSIFFFTYMREFLNADISLIESIDTISQETRKVNIKSIASKLQYDIRTGYLLSDAMRKQPMVFSGISISLVAVSEKINALSTACNHIVNYLNFGIVLTRKVKTVVTYPIVMITMIFGMVIFYSTFVIPKLEAIFTEFDESAKMPIQTVALVAFSSFISNYWALIVTIIITTPIIMVFLYKRSDSIKSMLDSFALKVPILSSIIIKSQLSRFSLFTANMYERGYNFLDSISEALIVLTNDKMRADFENMIITIQSGESVYKALREIPYIPRFVHRMFRVAEATSNIQRPLTSIYDFYNQEIQNDLDRILQLIKPLAIIVVGALMIWIVSATLLPFYAKIPQLLSSTHG
jgi:type II secretory pathway component PulF